MTRREYQKNYQKRWRAKNPERCKKYRQTKLQKLKEAELLGEQEGAAMTYQEIADAFNDHLEEIATCELLRKHGHRFLESEIRDVMSELRQEPESGFYSKQRICGIAEMGLKKMVMRGDGLKKMQKLADALRRARNIREG